MEKGLTEIKAIPNVSYGSVTFDPATRGVQGASYKRLVVRDGKFTLWDGKATPS